MEKIKDFLYDISDLLISILIIAAIFAVISWKLNESIPIESGTPSTPVAEAPKDSTPPDSTASETSNTPPTDASDADKPISDGNTAETNPGSENTPDANKPSDTEKPPAKTPAGSESTVQPPAGQSVAVEIPSGSTGFAIGKILKDKGLITDITAFTSKVEEMQLAPKLRSGTYQIKSGTSLENIIKILANVK